MPRSADQTRQRIPKLSCLRLISITPLPPRFGGSPLRAQQFVIEFANRLDHLLQFLIIVEPAPDFRTLTAHAELTRTTTRIAHRQHEYVVALTACAFWASLAVPHSALQQRAAQQLASDRQFVDQLVARTDGLFANHCEQ